MSDALENFMWWEAKDLADQAASAVKQRDHFAAALEEIVAKGSGIVQKGSFAHQLVEIARAALREEGASNR